MAYYRKGDKTLLVVGNYQKEPQTIELAGAVSYTHLAKNIGGKHYVSVI